MLHVNYASIIIDFFKSTLFQGENSLRDFHIYMNSIMHTIWLSSSLPKNLLKQRQGFFTKAKFHIEKEK